MNWFLMAVKQKYADFSGRARRREYWFFLLVYLLINIALLTVDNLLGWFDADSGVGVLSGIFTLALLIPSLSVSVRRLHDTDRSGWWLLIGFVPLIGGVILLVFFVQDSHAGTNRFGPNPKDAG